MKEDKRSQKQKMRGKRREASENRSGEMENVRNGAAAAQRFHQYHQRRASGGGGAGGGGLPRLSSSRRVGEIDYISGQRTLG